MSKLSWLFMSRKEKAKRKLFFQNWLNYFKLEEDEKGFSMTLGITERDVVVYFSMMAEWTQKAFKKHPDIKNYLMGKWEIGGQIIEFAIMKDEGKSPHLLREKAEAKVFQLEAKIKSLESQLRETESPDTAPPASTPSP